MIFKKTLLSLFCITLIATSSFSQQKRSLTHEDYDGWESMSSTQITDDGKWVGFSIQPQEGDARVEIFPYSDPSKRTIIHRGSGYNFSPSGIFAIGKIVPEADTVRMMKLRKAKKDEMPKDSLFILDLNTGQMEKFANVKSFSIPEKEGDWYAIHFEKPEKQKEEEKHSGEEKGEAKSESDSTETKPKELKTDGTRLLVKSHSSGTEYTFERVESYGFSKDGNYMHYVLAEQDTLDNAGLYLLDLNSGASTTLSEGMTSYSKMKFSPQSNYFSYLSTGDSTKAEKKYHQAFLTDVKSGEVKEFANKESEGILEGGRISSDASFAFSEDESRLFFGVAEDYKDYPYENDTTILDEERPSLDIWGWQDAEIQPMQLNRKSREERRSYLATYDISSGKITQLEDKELKEISLPSKIKLDMALGTSNDAYMRAYSWDIQIGRDIYLVDFATGKRKLIKENASGYPSLSPQGKFVTWYESRDSTWMAYEVGSGQMINLSQGIDQPVYDELNDQPSLPRSYGSAGWLKDDEAFLIYDRYDIWKVNPKNPSNAINITAGKGRENKVEFRRVVLDREEESIDPEEDLYLRAFNEQTKDSGFYLGDISSGAEPEEILMTAHYYFSLAKAKESDEVLVRRSTFEENPDLYLTDLDMDDLQKVSNLNPQQEEINWGTVELVDYLASDGTPLQGLLYKPENFDPNKEYPMMVYFYERNSDNLHRYRSPAPSASVINIPYFVSNEYVVLVPDIKYELGLPGPSAFNCIIPAVQEVVGMGFVDEENMAIQGQSWGGYQVAYLITQTNMFKAAGAGAPVVNMTSAYGGIRWGTGMSRMFQYEQTQSRIGGTLWDKPLYYIENSPLFFMDRVETPVLIMHNDEDGAVPWYQGIEMFMALKRLNQPAWLLQYNGEDHNLRQRKNRKDLSIRLSQFFDHYLKGAPAPLWMTEGLPAVEKGKTLKYELEN
ncbi:S9 family peptidase [Algoriphagus sediminis]|uniref:Prolyl oligopeptidase family serine peptidase n=1 Tax=Algoriphagus sediminis TaxID=3057113 RepID=A0ABT7YE23_9BACT|nr:prolyl oligopeptidase family serine peptidase [Algoriphagus sediminis]MDN3204773.1 prolyl oligopeptidase family serine peptidase [Algoriphagus sediminis]